MTSTGGHATDGGARLERAALVAYAVLWLLVGGAIAVVVRLGVPTPAELLEDVADRPALWIAANAVLIAQQALLGVAVPALVRVVGAAGVSDAALRGVAAIAGGALVASGAVHGVFGAHLASQVSWVGTEPPDADLVRLAELVHALGDTFWFIGVGALTAVTAIGSWALWRGFAARRRLAIVGAAAVACNLAQFGWFVDHAVGAFAAPGALLQAVWIAGVGLAAASGDPPPGENRPR